MSATTADVRGFCDEVHLKRNAQLKHKSAETAISLQKSQFEMRKAVAEVRSTFALVLNDRSPE